MITRDKLQTIHTCVWLFGILTWPLPAMATFTTACKAEVLQPATFQLREKRVMVTESSVSYTNIPSEMAWRDMVVQVEPARHQQEIEPAIYEEVDEVIEVERARTELRAEAAQYTSTTRRVKKQDAHQTWRTNCIGTVQDCLEKIPEQYDDLTVQVVEKPARIIQTLIPAKTVMVARKVLKQAGKGLGSVPARYQNIKVAYVAKPWAIKAQFHPAEYKTIAVQHKVRPEQLLTLPVVCSEALEPNQIRKLQQRLQQLGYPIKISGQYDSATQQTLIQFQKDQQIAMGALTGETLRKLGLF